jgi:hypothetical protein
MRLKSIFRISLFRQEKHLIDKLENKSRRESHLNYGRVPVYFHQQTKQASGAKPPSAFGKLPL